MRRLYPLADPFVQHSLAVGEGHVLHVAEYGRADGIPALFLHGGPGGASRAWQPRLFDPAVYRIVVFDQRGCGRSTPHASLQANTTDHLLADIECIREHLAIERWLAGGVGWGATLGLAYAERHPGRVSGLLLQGVFLCRPMDIDWFFRHGAHRLLPEAWREFLAPLPAAERDDPLAAYHRRLFGADDIARMAAAKAWAAWQGRASSLLPDGELRSHFGDPSVALPLARIQCDYLAHGGHLAPDQLLRDADRLGGIDGAIVHGRYDLVCPIDQAAALAAAWPGGELDVVDDAGHAATEVGTVDALVRATDRLAGRLSP